MAVRPARPYAILQGRPIAPLRSGRTVSALLRWRVLRLRGRVTGIFAVASATSEERQLGQALIVKLQLIRKTPSSLGIANRF